MTATLESSLTSPLSHPKEHQTGGPRRIIFSLIVMKCIRFILFLPCPPALIGRPWFAYRYFGDGAKNQHESKDLQLLLTNVFVAFSSFVISDYIPSLSFVSKLQGIHTKFENLVKSTMELAERIFEVEKHREQAKRRLLQQNTDKDYVPDFVDVLLAAPLEDGQPLPDHETTTVLVVRIMCYISCFFISKVLDMPNSIAYLNRTPIVEWFRGEMWP